MLCVVVAYRVGLVKAGLRPNTWQKVLVLLRQQGKFAPGQALGTQTDSIDPNLSPEDNVPALRIVRDTLRCLHTIYDFDVEVFHCPIACKLGHP